MNKEFKNIIISSVNPMAKDVILLSHGGYTPRRDIVRSGSGAVIVPQGITIAFNSREDELSYGGPDSLLEGSGFPFADIALPGSSINNYSLVYHQSFERQGHEPNETYDLIRVSSAGKAHMKDVFEAIEKLNLTYQRIIFFPCRINKLTKRVNHTTPHTPG